MDIIGGPRLGPVPSGLSFHHVIPAGTTPSQICLQPASATYLEDEAHSLSVATELVEGPNLPKTLRAFSRFIARFVILCRGGADSDGGFSPAGDNSLLESNANESVTYSDFTKFIEMVLNTTDVSRSMSILASYYVYTVYYTRMKENWKMDGMTDKMDFIAGLMIANKVLDDHTYTNRTWSDLSDLSLEEVNRIEIQYLQCLGYRTVITREEYIDWVDQIHQASRVMSHGRGHLPGLLEPLVQKAKSDAAAKHRAEMHASSAKHVCLQSSPSIVSMLQQSCEAERSALAAEAVRSLHFAYSDLQIPSSVEASAAVAAESLSESYSLAAQPSAGQHPYASVFAQPRPEYTLNQHTFGAHPYIVGASPFYQAHSLPPLAHSHSRQTQVAQLFQGVPSHQEVEASTGMAETNAGYFMQHVFMQTPGSETANAHGGQHSYHGTRGTQHHQAAMMLNHISPPGSRI
ncbi:hypothetical protein HDU96_004506 [Phlyctochytrium bullatum]|nr:hypothetical protein HDU96_004506 [Phlyctochytrium bullatum]